MMYDYTIDANARKNIKNARAWINRLKNDLSLSRSKKGWAITCMRMRAERDGQNEVSVFLKKARKKFRI